MKPIQASDHGAAKKGAQHGRQLVQHSFTHHQGEALHFYIFERTLQFWRDIIFLEVTAWLELATDLLVCNNVQQLLMQQLMQQLLMH